MRVSNVSCNTYTKSTNTSQQTDDLTATVHTTESSIKPRGQSQSEIQNGKSKHALKIIVRVYNYCQNIR